MEPQGLTTFGAKVSSDGPVRTRLTVVMAALIAATTLVALPSPAGSRTPAPAGSLAIGAFHPLVVARPVELVQGVSTEPDPAWRSAGGVGPDAPFAESTEYAFPASRPRIAQPFAPVRFVVKRVWHFDPEASFYGPGFYGKRTACGQAYTKSIVGVAHRTLPCGTRVQFRNPANGRVMTVAVIDRGPYVPGRIWDLSGALCRALDHCYTGPIEWRLAG